MNTKILSYLFLGVVLLGLADSLYLSITTFLQVSPVCGPAHGCDIVQTSKYAHFFGIPWAYLGALYYLVGTFIGASLSASERARQIAIWFGALGVVVAMWSVYLQAFVIKAFCVYCTALDLFQVVLLVLALLIWRNARSDNPAYLNS